MSAAVVAVFDPAGEGAIRKPIRRSSAGIVAADRRRRGRRIYNAAMTPLSILFICIGNTCRSPMAEAIARGLGGDEVRAASAGIMPYGRIVPTTVATLTALGYDPRGLDSKGLDAIELADVDIVVSLLGPDVSSAIPAIPGAQLECWDVPDPFGEDDDAYLAVARDLEHRIRALLEEHRARELPLV